MKKQKSFSIELTSEELIAAIKLCGGGLIYALDNPLRLLEAEQAEKIELKAIENLTQKGLIRKDALGSYAMDLTFSEVLDMMRYAETVVRVSQEGKLESFSIYLISEDQVVWAPAGEKSKLVVFKDHDSIWPMAEELFQNKSIAIKKGSFQIEALELEIAQHFLSEKRFEDAIKVFTEKEIPSDDAADFLNCVQSATSRLRLDTMRINRIEDLITSARVEVLSCPNEIFWIETLQKPEKTEPRMVQVSSGTIQDIRKKFLALTA